MGASRVWWKRFVEKVSFELGIKQCVVEGESGEQVGGELESVTSSVGCFMQG